MLALRCLSALSLFLFASASPAKFEPKVPLPVVKLPYGSFRAEYDRSTDIYSFKNIPYAAPPVGDLRWRKPAPPLKYSGVQDGSHGPSCIQGPVSGLNVVGPGNSNPIGQAVNQFVAGLPIPLFSGGDEDCLYLDVHVPAKAVKNPALRLPVVAYIFGGGYVLGSKDTYQPFLPFYDGSGMMEQADNNMIFISFNYRLGALGFLAGTTMERDGLPNAGLWDQRAVFEWIQKHVTLFGGDPSHVTAMGESAGAGSIVHHLVAEGGTLDPLFHKAILLSPAFEPIWDRAGLAETAFKNFAKIAGCENQGLDCLRAAPQEKLVEANKGLMDMQLPGSFAVGPTPDGAFIRQLPVLELTTGNFWQIDSLLMSHCAHEATNFVSGAVKTNADFDDFVHRIFPDYTTGAGTSERVIEYYKAPGSKGGFKNQAERMEAFLRDSSMTCNIRYLNEAYGDNKVWNMQYSVAPGWHAADLFAVFYNPKLTDNSWMQTLASFALLPLGVMFAGIARAMQSYLVSYALTGDPNKKRVVWNVPPTIQWNHPDTRGERVKKVVNVGNWWYSTVEDTQMPRSGCDFWREFSGEVTALGGYMPPDLGVANSSWNYQGGNIQE